MRHTRSLAVLLLTLGCGACVVRAEDDVTVVAPATEAAEGLDLQAVAELFKDSKDLQDFETKLNDPKVGVNNLDLDGNGRVDYIRVVEETSGDTHLVVLQAALGEDDDQDVATIEMDRSDSDTVDMQVHGAGIIYGPEFYIAPVEVHVHAWPALALMFGPLYHPYGSVWSFRHYPRGWRPWRPVGFTTYQRRTVVYTRRGNFRHARTTRVTTVSRVKYHPHASKRVKRTKITVRKGPHHTTVKKTTTHRRR